MKRRELLYTMGVGGLAVVGTVGAAGVNKPGDGLSVDENPSKWAGEASRQTAEVTPMTETMPVMTSAFDVPFV